MALQTPPILTSSYNNGGGGAITPPPDPATARSSGGGKQMSPPQHPQQPSQSQQHQRIAPAPMNYSPGAFINVSNLAGMAGVPLNMNLGQCCTAPIPQQQQQQQQQQFIMNDNGITMNNPKLMPQLQNKPSNIPCDTNSPHPNAVTNNTASTAPTSIANAANRLMQPTTSERPESIVFLYQIPNDSKIYLVKCVEVSQLLDIDYRGIKQPPQQNLIKHHLEQHLNQRFQPHQVLSQSQQQQFLQQQPTPYQLQQHHINATIQQLRHHPYQQQRPSPKSLLNVSVGKNIKTPGTNNGPSMSLQNIGENHNNNNNNNNNNSNNNNHDNAGTLIDQTADLQPFTVEMNQNVGNYDLMLPMTTGAAPGAYMVTPSATPTMRNDQLIVTNYLAAQQQALLANTQSQNIFNAFDKNGSAN